MAKPKRRDGAKERYWRGVLRQWRRSGLTGRHFCAEQGLSEPSFYAWRRVIAKRDQERLAAAGRGPAAVAAPAIPAARPPAARPPAARPVAPAAPAFVKIAVARDPSEATTSAIEVVVSGRRVVRVRPGFDADLLRQLVRLLEEPTC